MRCFSPYIKRLSDFVRKSMSPSLSAQGPLLLSLFPPLDVSAESLFRVVEFPAAHKSMKQYCKQEYGKRYFWRNFAKFISYKLASF